MKRTLPILALTALAACSSMEPTPDEFTTIAEKWQGGLARCDLNSTISTA